MCVSCRSTSIRRDLFVRRDWDLGDAASGVSDEVPVASGQPHSILFLPRRADPSDTLISPVSKYGQSLKWTRVSVPACRSLPVAAGSSIHKIRSVTGDIMLVDHFQ